MAGGATAGSSREFRLDPNSLPVRFSAPMGGPEAAIVLDRERAVVRRAPKGGHAVTFAIPVSAYDGVAVRAESDGAEGEIVHLIVELRHSDPSLTLPLCIADEPQAVAADWQAWAQVLNLPLLLIEQDGSVRQPLTEDVPPVTATVGRPPTRRRHSYFAARRPRFLVRRKTGRGSQGERLAGREIIARD